MYVSVSGFDGVWNDAYYFGSSHHRMFPSGSLITYRCRYLSVNLCICRSIDKSVLKNSDLTTHCYWKGDASYYTLSVNGE